MNAEKEGNSISGIFAANVRLSLTHRAEIDMFGRYPVRNEKLGRKSTAAEIEYLKKK